MVDTAGELVQGMRDMRIRNAILVTALLKLGGRFEVSHEDAFAAAAYDIEIRNAHGALHVSLKDAPK